MYTQEHAKAMYTQLRYTQLILNQLGFKTLAGKIEDCLKTIDTDLQEVSTPSANNPTSVKLTTSEYAVIHAVNKLFKK